MATNDDTRTSRRTVLAVLGAAMLPGCRRDWTPPELDPTSRSQVKPYVRGAEMFDTFEEHWVNTTCAQCPAACGVRVRVVEGRAVRIEANAKSPLSCGGMCVPGLAGLHTLYDPDRITQPLRRVRGLLQPVSWDAALAELTSALAMTRSRGPERLLVMSGLERGFRHELMARFCRTFGSPNFVDGSPSHTAPLALAMERTLGVRELPAYRWQGAGAILSLETGLFEDAYQSVHFARAVAAMRRDRIGGARLVHAGPAFDLAAYNADRWLRIQPGTSGALALGIAHVLLRDGTYDRAIDGAPSIAGFRALAESFPPERVASVTGCDPGALEQTARELWTRRPVLVVVDERSLAFTNGLDTASIAIALSALLGSLEVEAGGMRVAPLVPTAAWAEPELDAIATAGLATPRLDGAGAGRFEGARSVLETLPPAIDKAPPEIALVFETNPAYARAQPERWRAALARIPLVVSFSPFLDETTRETAHLVLPDHTYLERFEDGTPAPGAARGVAGVRRPVVTPLYDTRSTADVVIELAKEIGFARAFPWPTATAAFEERWIGLQTTGRGTIHTDDSRAFLDCLYDAGFWAETDDAPAATRILDAPTTWTEPRWDGDPDRFPLRLVPYQPLGHSAGSANEPWQHNLYPRPGLGPWQFAASISAADAPRGIRTGDKIRVVSPHGELVVTAHVDPRIAPGCIAIPTGGGHHGSGRWADDFGVNVMQLVAPTGRRRYGSLGTLHDPRASGGGHMSLRAWFMRIFDDTPMSPERRSFLAATATATATATAMVAIPRTSQASSARPRRRRHWGMVIDLGRCSACNACGVACREENNVPSFGPDATFDGARPEWMSLLWQEPQREGALPSLTPLPCMHCADPPCVKVCPVGATYKDPDGFTMQVWDRCIGCRYCMVACPYSRRSFNWSEPTWSPTEQQALNPDVATRPKGVVEKCTFCHHRVRRACEEAALAGREPADTELQRLPACAAACPSAAITFGDLDDPDSQVATFAASPRAFRLLEHLGTEPSVYYLEKDRG